MGMVYKVHVMISLYVFTNPPARAGCDTWLIFERSLTGLNSGVFFLLDWLGLGLPNQG